MSEGFMTDGVSDPAFEKVSRLLDFLEAYFRIARPPLRDIAGYNEYLLRQPNLPDVPGVVFSPGGDIWLVAALVAHSDPPEIPADLLQWLDPGTISPHIRPVLELSQEPTDEEFAGALLAEDWAEAHWGPWAEEWKRIESSRTFYKDLYSLRTRLERDGDGFELVWGFGRLRWLSAGRTVDHPLVTVPVEIHLHEDGRLAVSISGTAQVEASFVGDLELADHPLYQAYRSESAAADLDMWNDESRGSLLDQLLRAISHDGVRSDHAPQDDFPVLTDEWVLYLRRRQADYVAFLEQQRELYRAGVLPSLPFLSLVVDRPSELAADYLPGSNRSDATEIVDSTLYLPKAANEEQFRILRLAQQRAGVTAQGPPGTGKSHTIANLICHFVSEGKRVLVTAEKEQALSVLAEKLPAGVRELSVTVGGGDSSSYSRLERAVTAIQGRVSGFDASHITRSIDQATLEIARIDADQAATQTQLRAARSFEADHLSGRFEAGQDPTPTEVGEWLANSETELSFVPDAIDMRVSFPLDADEWTDFVRLCSALDPQDVETCRQPRPLPGFLPSGSSLGQRFSELSDLRSHLADIEADVISWDQLDESADKLRDLIDVVRDAAEWRRKISGTWLDRIRNECLADIGRHEWVLFAGSIRAAREQAVVQRMVTAAHSVELPTDLSPEFREGLREARERLSEGKRVSNLLHRQAARALEVCRVDGRTPADAQQVGLCFAAVIRMDSQHELVVRWRNGTSRIGGPELRGDQPPEDSVVDYLEAIERAMDWGDDELPSLRRSIEAVGLRSPEDPSVEDLDQLVSLIELATRRQRERTLIIEIDQIDRTLRDHQGRESSATWDKLAEAFAGHMWTEWDTQLSEASRLALLEADVTRYCDLLDRLRLSSPRFAEQIVQSRGAGAPDHTQVLRGWQWRKLDQWLSMMTSGPSTGELQFRLESLARRRLFEMERLVEARAWRGLAEGFTDENRAALNKYLTAVRRFGKTGGKYAERWRREIREALDDSKDAIPVWIMPASRVLESFRPASDPPFDVLIVDEASQIGLLGVPILALGKQAIVVGDDQQTSPENVGLDRQAVFNLIDIHLGKIRDSRTLFDGDNSLYDVSRQKFPEIVVLREHFRCLPPIIAFSNGRYYGGEMIPLRDRPPTTNWRPVGTVFVPDGFRDGRDVNEPEALAAVDLIEELVADPAYDGMSFGFIGLLGRVQSLRVQELLLDRLGLDEIEQRRIRCGEAADFQGDERDVVIIGTVVDGGRRIGSFSDRRSERRLNVAASRAENQLWIVHSIEAEDFPNGDGRAELIRHCQNPVAVDAAYSNLEQRCESQFERDVLRAILERGYRRVRTQYSAGRYRIDIVIEGPTTRLAVECDGDRWHGQDQWDADRSRQQILERSGWTFERIRGSAFFRHREHALDRLWTRLDELGIPTGEWGEHHGQDLATRRVSPTMAERMAGGNSSESTHTGIPLDLLPEMESQIADLEAEERDYEEPTVAGTPNRAIDTVRRYDSAARYAATETGLADEGHETAPTASAGMGQPRLANVAEWAIGHDRPEQAATRSDERHQATTQSGYLQLVAYVEWPVRPVASASVSPPEQVIDELVEIVASEGPILGHCLYRVHARAAGTRRVRSQLTGIYNKIVYRSLREGRLAQLHDDVAGQADKTIYLPGSSPVVPRQLGSRAIHEVPPSELRNVASQLGVESVLGESGKRMILAAYGLKKLTEKTSSFLDDCLKYQWSQ